MALISCKECNNQISDTVVNCPHCGFIYHKPTTIVENPYNGKKNIVIGKVMVIGGLIFFLVGVFNNISFIGTIGFFAFIIGFIILCVGRFQHWWHWK